MEKISCIIPTHNEENCIVECLLSLATQTVRPDEVLIADYHSSDRTIELSKIVLEGNIDYKILDLDRRGIGYGREIARQSARRGNIILSLDADAILPFDLVERVLKRFENPQVIMVTGAAEAKEKGPIQCFSELVGLFWWGGKGYCMAFRNDLGLEYRQHDIGEDYVIWNDAVKLMMQGKGIVVYDPTLKVLCRMPTTGERGILKFLGLEYK